MPRFTGSPAGGLVTLPSTLFRLLSSAKQAQISCNDVRTFIADGVSSVGHKSCCSGPLVCLKGEWVMTPLTAAAAGPKRAAVTRSEQISCSPGSYYTTLLIKALNVYVDN
jgi:hypothetical protein